MFEILLMEGWSSDYQSSKLLLSSTLKKNIDNWGTSSILTQQNMGDYNCMLTSTNKSAANYN